MSTIGVKYHDEDIHNIIQRPMSPIVKSPRYKSRRLGDVKDELKQKKRYNGHQTFGLAHYEPPESWNYLRKGKSKIQPPTPKPVENESKCTKNCKSSSIPKPNFEKPKPSRKNYVKENIKRIGTIEPKLPPPRKVETPRGTVKDMAHLLQMIRIRQSDQYGQIPKYLCERKKQWSKEKEKAQQKEEEVKAFKEKMGIGTMGMGENVYMIDKETRQKLLDGLKENWNDLSNQFLKLPVMIDTWTKIRRKIWLEREIDQLEKDVRLLERHPYIYLERTDRRPYEQILAEETERGRLAKEQSEKEVKEKETEKQAEVQQEVLQPSPEEPAAAEEETYEVKKEEDEELKILNY